MSERSAFTPETQGQAKAFAFLVARSVQDFFRDPSNRAKFERWYESRYGEPYHWKTIGMEE